MEEKIKKLNEIIEDYINYLYRCNPMLLDNAEFFFLLTKYEEGLVMEKENYVFQKTNAIDSFNIVKEFINKNYPENNAELEQLFKSGLFDIYYLDELAEEKIYLTKEEKTFCQNNSKITLPLFGDTRDIPCIMHEIRHQLNQPNKKRGLSNDMLTEGLSIFDEFLIFDFLKDKLNEEEINKLIRINLNALIRGFGIVNFVCKMIIIKNKLGYINLENYNILFKGNDLEQTIKNVNLFLKQHNSYKDIDIHIQVWYVFGVCIASFMHQKYIENNDYLEKFKLLNEKVKNNHQILECLDIVGIDLNDPNIFSTLRNSVIKEIKSTEKVNKI